MGPLRRGREEMGDFGIVCDAVSEHEYLVPRSEVVQLLYTSMIITEIQALVGSNAHYDKNLARYPASKTLGFSSNPCKPVFSM